MNPWFIAGAAGAVGGAAVGGVKGMANRVRDTEQMNADISRDAQALHEVGCLPEAQPSFPLTPRKQRPFWLCYLIGIPLGGFAIWLVTVIITGAVVAGYDSPDMHPSERFTAPLFAGFVAGTIGLFVPGIFVGGWLWIRESRARVRDMTAEPYRHYWHERQQIGAAVSKGHMAPQDGATALWQHRFIFDDETSVVDPAVGTYQPAEPEPVTGSWHGQVGGKMAIDGEVQSVQEVYGDGFSLERYHQHWLRTKDGDLISWMTSREHCLRPGDVVTLEGTVKAHSRYGDEALTEMWYCRIVGDVARPPRP